MRDRCAAAKEAQPEAPARRTEHGMFALQRAVGNRAVGVLLSASGGRQLMRIPDPAGMTGPHGTSELAPPPPRPETSSSPAAPTAAPTDAPAGGGAAGARHELVQLVDEYAQRLATRPAPLLPVTTASGPFGRRMERAMSEDRRRLLGPTPEGMRELEPRLVAAFQQEAVAEAHRLLDQNERVARSEAGRYVENTSGDPTTQANRLRSAAAEMGAIQRQIITRLNEHGNALMAQYGGPQANVTADRFDDFMRGSLAENDPVIVGELKPRLDVLKRIYGPEFPVLLKRNTDYTAIAQADPETLARTVAQSTSEVLASIRTLRARLAPDDIWSLPPLVEATRRRMGIPPGTRTPSGAAIARAQAAAQADEALLNIGLAALGLTLAIGAIVLTGGAAAPAVGSGAALAGGGMALASGALSVYGAVEEASRYELQQSAAGAALDPAQALAAEEPSFAWLALALAGVVAEAGSLVVAFRNLSAAARLVQRADQLRLFEDAARAQARVLAAEGRLGAMSEDDFIRAVMTPARSRLGGAATSTLRHGSLTFAPNPGGPRSLPDAVALARAHGVEIGDDILIRSVDNLPADEFARYGTFRERGANDIIRWNDLVEEVQPPRGGRAPSYWTQEPIEEPTAVIRIQLRADVLASDEAIVATLAHEMHELNNLRRIFAERGGAMRMSELMRLVNGTSGTLHLEAWRVAEELVARMRATRPPAP